MVEIGVITLRSALSGDDQGLDQERRQFLDLIDPQGQFNFVEPRFDIPNVFFVQTGGTEILFKGMYEKFPEPYYILVQGKRNSLAASLEIKTFCTQHNKRCRLILGEPKQCLETLQQMARFYEVERQLSSMKLGVIGTPSDWLIASGYDVAAIKKAFGVEIVEIPMQEFLDAVEAQKNVNENDMAKFLKKTDRESSLRVSLQIYGALSHLVSKYGLSGFTLRCFDLLMEKKETSCLAFATLNDEGIIATCEGDVPTLLTMALIQALTGKPSFMANPSEFDLGKNEAIFAHCTCPLSMLTSYALTTHFESGLGFGIHGQFAPGRMSVAKIAPDMHDIRAMGLTMLESLSRNDLCRSQIHVRFDEPMAPLLDDPYGNHMAFFYGDFAKEIRELFAYLTINR